MVKQRWAHSLLVFGQEHGQISHHTQGYRIPLSDRILSGRVANGRYMGRPETAICQRKPYCCRSSRCRTSLRASLQSVLHSVHAMGVPKVGQQPNW